MPGGTAQPCQREGLKVGGQELFLGCPGQGGGTGVVLVLPGICMPVSPGPARYPEAFPGAAPPQGTVPARLSGCPGGVHCAVLAGSAPHAPEQGWGAIPPLTGKRANPTKTKCQEGAHTKGQEVENNIFNESYLLFF